MTGTHCGVCSEPIRPRGSAGVGREHGARGLCRSCYGATLKRGEHLDFPAYSRTRDEFADDYRMLKAAGLNRRQMAERLKMKYNSFDRQYHRLVNAGLLERAR